MQPIGYENSNVRFRLFKILHKTLPNEIWKKHRRPLGYREETHKKFKLPKLPPLPPPNPDTSQTAWNQAKRIVRKVLKKEPIESIMSTSPRIATAAKFGPNLLARPCFPNILETPMPTLSEEKIAALEQQRQAQKLAGTSGLYLGGRKNSIASLEAFANSIKYDEYNEDEPLRTMAIREVTLIKK